MLFHRLAVYAINAFEIGLYHVLFIWMLYQGLTSSPEFKSVTLALIGLWLTFLVLVLIAWMDKAPHSAKTSAGTH